MDVRESDLMMHAVKRLGEWKVGNAVEIEIKTGICVKMARSTNLSVDSSELARKIVSRWQTLSYARRVHLNTLEFRRTNMRVRPVSCKQACPLLLGFEDHVYRGPTTA